jgi:DeoR/GlpR family transcriptional regulator of sugar metabolism
MKPRSQQLLDHLDSIGACTYQELAELLGVSAMTIRRDADELAGHGKLIKTVGGVQKANAPGYLYESELQLRVGQNVREKRAIARAALQLIEPGQTLFLDGSTTCLELAKVMADSCHRLTVVTPSALVAMELGRNSDLVVIGVGGQYDPDSLCFVGPTSEQWMRQFFVDQAFMSTKAYVPDEGTFESSIATFRVKQVVASQCEHLTLLVDHSKFGQRALCKVLDASQIHSVVTDERTRDTDLEFLHRSGTQLHVAALEQFAHAT